MTAPDVQRLFLERFGLRVGPEVADYVLRTWQAGAKRVAVIASDAGTGAALARVLHAAELSSAFDDEPRALTAD